MKYCIKPVLFFASDSFRMHSVTQPVIEVLRLVTALTESAGLMPAWPEASNSSGLMAQYRRLSIRVNCLASSRISKSVIEIAEKLVLIRLLWRPLCITGVGGPPLRVEPGCVI